MIGRKVRLSCDSELEEGLSDVVEGYDGHGSSIVDFEKLL